MNNKSSVLFLVCSLAALLAGCSSSSPTEPPPDNAQLVLTRSQAYVDGTPLAGSTRQRGFGEGSSMLFEGALMQGEMAATGELVWMEFDRPQTGMGGGCCGGMGGRHTGRIELYDDGTHGDEVAGDGIYHYEDAAGEFGCQRQSDEAGEYHYEFYGQHQDGAETNHITMTITING